MYSDDASKTPMLSFVLRMLDLTPEKRLTAKELAKYYKY